MSNEAERQAAGARVLREVLRTPAFRDIIKLNLAAAKPEAARELVRTLIWEDPNLSLSLAAVSPQTINALVEVLLELGRQLGRFPPDLTDQYAKQIAAEVDAERLRELPRVWAPLLLRHLPGLVRAHSETIKALAESLDGLPPEERAERVRTAARGIDGAAWGEAATAVAQAVLQIYRENPDLMTELQPALEAAVQATDFGKLREATAALAHYGSEAAVMYLDPALKDPVVMSNLAMSAAPLLNALLKVLAHGLEKVDLPDEFLASALFNLLGELDRDELARATNAAANLVNALHAGNLVLGRDEPRFRAVFAEFAAGVAEKVNTRAVADAAIALSEDLEVVWGVLTRLLLRDPQLLTLAVSTAVTCQNAAWRGFADALHEAGRLPDEVLAQVGGEIQTQLETKEIARGVNAAFLLFNRFAKQNPDLYRELVGTLVPAIDREQVAAAWQVISSQVDEALAPKRVGRRLNEALVRFNRRMERGDGVGAYLKHVFAEVDAKELQKAMRHLAGGFTEALLASGARAMAVIKPLFAAGWKLTVFPLAYAKRKLLKQDATEDK